MGLHLIPATENFGLHVRMNFIRASQFGFMFVKPFGKLAALGFRKLQDRLFYLFDAHGGESTPLNRVGEQKFSPTNETPLLIFPAGEDAVLDFAEVVEEKFVLRDGLLDELL